MRSVQVQMLIYLLYLLYLDLAGAAELIWLKRPTYPTSTQFLTVDMPMIIHLGFEIAGSPQS